MSDSDLAELSNIVNAFLPSRGLLLWTRLLAQHGELRAWATNRIAWCEAKEGETGRVAASHCPSTERRALEAVLRILDGKETP